MNLPVLRHIAANPGATLYDLEASLGLPKERVKRALYDLGRQGCIEHADQIRVKQCTRPVSRWKVTTKGSDRLAGQIKRREEEARLSAPPRVDRITASMGGYSELGPFSTAAWHLGRTEPAGPAIRV